LQLPSLRWYHFPAVHNTITATGITAMNATKGITITTGIEMMTGIEVTTGTGMTAEINNE
jgi:hypothetical protein